MKAMHIPMHHKKNKNHEVEKLSMWNHYDIQRVLKKQRSLISENDKLNHQRHLFEEESNKLNFFINNETVDIVWIVFSGTFMAKKRSTLGLCRDYVLAKQFDEPPRAQQDKTTP